MLHYSSGRNRHRRIALGVECTVEINSLSDTELLTRTGIVYPPDVKYERQRFNTIAGAPPPLFLSCFACHPVDDAGSADDGEDVRRLIVTHDSPPQRTPHGLTYHAESRALCGTRTVAPRDIYPAFKVRPSWNVEAGGQGARGLQCRYPEMGVFVGQPGWYQNIVMNSSLVIFQLSTSTL